MCHKQPVDLFGHVYAADLSRESSDVIIPSVFNRGDQALSHISVRIGDEGERGREATRSRRSGGGWGGGDGL